MSRLVLSFDVARWFGDLDLDELEADEHSIELIPPEVATKFQVVPIKREGRILTVAMANLVTALGREDEALLNDARRRSALLLGGRALGQYERALLEILDAGVAGDTARVSAALSASVSAWPIYFKSNRWRDDHFVVLDACALFNLVRARVGSVAFPDHERWRTPPALERGPGRALVDFSTRVPVIDRWWRSFPELADAGTGRT